MSLRAIRAVIVAVIVLGVVALFAVVGDAVARGYAENTAGDMLQRKVGTAQRPHVKIQGWPFLTQAAAGRYDHVTVDAVGVTTPSVKLDELHADLFGLRTSRDMSVATADHAAGTALVGWDAVKNASSTPITYVDPGRVQVVYSATFFGQQIQAKITATPQLDEASQTIQLTDPAIAIAGINLPSDAAAGLIKQLVKPIGLPLPASLHATKLTAGANGLTIAFTGENVDLTTLK